MKYSIKPYLMIMMCASLLFMSCEEDEDNGGDDLALVDDDENSDDDLVLFGDVGINSEQVLEDVPTPVLEDEIYGDLIEAQIIALNGYLAAASAGYVPSEDALSTSAVSVNTDTGCFDGDEPLSEQYTWSFASTDLTLAYTLAYGEDSDAYYWLADFVSTEGTESFEYSSNAIVSKSIFQGCIYFDTEDEEGASAFKIDWDTSDEGDISIIYEFYDEGRLEIYVNADGSGRMVDDTYTYSWDTDGVLTVIEM